MAFSMAGSSRLGHGLAMGWRQKSTLLVGTFQEGSILEDTILERTLLECTLLEDTLLAWAMAWATAWAMAYDPWPMDKPGRGPSQRPILVRSWRAHSRRMTPLEDTLLAWPMARPWPGPWA